MLYGIFYWVVNISVVAAVAGIIVAAVGLMKPVPKRLPYELWGLVFLRFLIPAMYSSRFSIMNLLTKLGTKTVVIEKVIKNDVPVLVHKTPTMENTLGFAESYFPIKYSSEVKQINTLSAIFEKAALIWAIVAVAALLTVIMLYILTSLRFRKAIKLRDNIYISSVRTSPFTLGIFKQKIIIPYEMDGETLAFIEAHENVHIRRYDNLRRLIALTTACIHWFNPFVWLFIKLYFIDMELSCDSMAVKRLNVEERKDYARALLMFATPKKAALSSAFSGSGVKNRVGNILSFKALSALSTAAFTAFAIIVAYTIMTNAI